MSYKIHHACMELLSSVIFTEAFANFSDKHCNASCEDYKDRGPIDSKNDVHEYAWLAELWLESRQ